MQISKAILGFLQQNKFKAKLLKLWYLFNALSVNIIKKLHTLHFCCASLLHNHHPSHKYPNMIKCYYGYVPPCYVTLQILNSRLLCPHHRMQLLLWTLVNVCFQYLPKLKICIYHHHVRPRWKIKRTRPFPPPKAPRNNFHIFSINKFAHKHKHSQRGSIVCAMPLKFCRLAGTISVLGLSALA